MPDLRFNVAGVAADAPSATPMLQFALHIADANRPPTDIRSIDLRCQIRIEPARRRYESKEQDNLQELFGEPTRWGESARPMLWTHAQTCVPAFTGETRVTLPVPCTFDFNVVGTKYFHALRDGEVPLCLLFTGTVFYARSDGLLQAAPISWNSEAHFRLPVKTWNELMDRHYPNTAWLELHRDIFERLSEYKRQHALPTWEAALDSLLAAQREEVTA